MGENPFTPIFHYLVTTMNIDKIPICGRIILDFDVGGSEYCASFQEADTKIYERLMEFRSTLVSSNKVQTELWIDMDTSHQHDNSCRLTNHTLRYFIKLKFEKVVKDPVQEQWEFRKVMEIEVIKAIIELMYWNIKLGRPTLPEKLIYYLLVQSTGETNISNELITACTKIDPFDIPAQQKLRIVTKEKVVFADGYEYKTGPSIKGFYLDNWFHRYSYIDAVLVESDDEIMNSADKFHLYDNDRSVMVYDQHEANDGSIDQAALEEVISRLKRDFTPTMLQLSKDLAHQLNEYRKKYYNEYFLPLDSIDHYFLDYARKIVEILSGEEGVTVDHVTTIVLQGDISYLQSLYQKRFQRSDPMGILWDIITTAIAENMVTKHQVKTILEVFSNGTKLNLGREVDFQRAQDLHLRERFKN
jgi:hypothetical protein